MKNWWHEIQNDEAGQAGLIAILIAMVLTVIGLSVASRAGREAIISTSESEGTRTLEGAESGANIGLQTGFGSPTPAAPGADQGNNADDDTIFNTSTATQINDESLDLILEEGMSLELKGGIGGATIYWADSSLGGNIDAQAGLLISCYTGNAATFQGYKPAGGGSATRYHGNFNAASYSTVSGFQNMLSGSSVVSDLGNCSNSSIVRIKALYATTVIRVNGVSGDNIRQVRGAAVNEQDDQGRVVEVHETAPGRPSVLDYALFAGNGSIAKN